MNTVNSMPIRAFFALPVQDSVAKGLADYADTLCEYDRGLEALWVDSAGYHLTLLFMETLSLEQVTRLEAAAQSALQGLSPFRVCLERTDYYPVNRKLSLVAAMPEEPAPLQVLRDALIKAVDSCGIGYHAAGFKPHVTLGRLPADNGFEVPTEWPALNQRLSADSVVLYQSRPGERGSIYSPLFSISLSGLTGSL